MARPHQDQAADGCETRFPQRLTDDVGPMLGSFWRARLPAASVETIDALALVFDAAHPIALVVAAFRNWSHLPSSSKRGSGFDRVAGRTGGFERAVQPSHRSRPISPAKAGRHHAKQGPGGGQPIRHTLRCLKPWTSAREKSQAMPRPATRRPRFLSSSPLHRPLKASPCCCGKRLPAA